MASSKNRVRVELPLELFHGYAAYAARERVPSAALVRAVLRAALVTMRRRMEGDGDPVAAQLAEGDVFETAARISLMEWGVVGLDGSLVRGYDADLRDTVVSPSGRGV